MVKNRNIQPRTIICLTVREACMKRLAFVLVWAVVFITLGMSGAATYAGTMNGGVTSGNQGDGSVQPSANTVIIKNSAFTPISITVPVGTTVTWVNQDTVPHTVTGARQGDPMSGTLQPGESYNFTFTRVGTVGYRCSIHPTMNGSVVVTPPNTPSGQSASSGQTPSISPSSTPPASSTPSSSSSSSGNTVINNTNINQATTGKNAPPPAQPPPPENNPPAMPNTGTVGAVTVFTSAAVIGTGLGYIYLRRSRTRG